MADTQVAAQQLSVLRESELYILGNQAWLMAMSLLVAGRRAGQAARRGQVAVTSRRLCLLRAIADVPFLVIVTCIIVPLLDTCAFIRSALLALLYQPVSRILQGFAHIHIYSSIAIIIIICRASRQQQQQQFI